MDHFSDVIELLRFAFYCIAMSYFFSKGGPLQYVCIPFGMGIFMWWPRAAVHFELLLSTVPPETLRGTVFSYTTIAVIGVLLIASVRSKMKKTMRPCYIGCGVAAIVVICALVADALIVDAATTP